ncbi:MAG: proline racemase [Sulfobacillus acidophilus]|uniref:Proline racemase n=1 Tax=Sulfobacillus acidophilus TaxID=53633 RepID=A0A2T2WL48_9FIRM|nr:MAG: proline racemase [Sulfobacillus acidophilus]
MNIREVFDVIDLHAGGEPLRIITAGYPPLRGRTVLDQRDELLAHYDHYRRRLMAEPWGHEDMSGCLLVSPERPDSLYGLIFMHNQGYSFLFGHAILAVTKMLVETGQVVFQAGAKDVSVRYDVPYGQITAHARLHQGCVSSVWFENVPAYVVALDQVISIGSRSIDIDVAFSGAFYALVDVKALQKSVNFHDLDDLRQWAQDIKAAVETLGLARHPHEPRFDGIDGVVFTDSADSPDHLSRQVTVFADGAVDRSPGSSGISARLAVLGRRQRVERNRTYFFESVIDTIFGGIVLGDAPPVDGHMGIRTAVEGQAFLTAFRRFYENPFDKQGPFLLR